MKLIIQLTAVLIVLTSCGALSPMNGKMRLVRTGNNEEVKVVERDAVSMIKQDKELAAVELKQEVMEEPGQSKAEVLSDATAEPEEQVEATAPDKRMAPEELLPDEDERIIAQAYRAERDANAAFWLFLSGLTSAFLPYLGIIPFIIGLIYYSRSKNSRYITQWGDRRTNAATVLLVIDGVILTLWVLLILVLILAL